MEQIHSNGNLSLQNDGRLEVVFLGTGTAFGQSLFQTNFLLIKGEHHVLVDFGMTGPVALRTICGVQPTDITHILPTHSHADHIGGLEYLTLLNRYVARRQGKPKLNMIVHEEYRSMLWEMSLRGGLEFNEVDGEGHRLTFDDFYNVVEPNMLSVEGRPRLSVRVGDIDIEMFRTNHIPGEAEDTLDAFITYGLFVDGRVFISGDTKFDPELIELYAAKSEVMFHDTAFVRNPVHASLEELRTLPEDVRKKMMLMHYPDSFADHPVDDFLGYAEQGVRYIF
jgi:ribonuclease BN (tRNA processing enzyme)